jgi:hypothetical protein
VELVALISGIATPVHPGPIIALLTCIAGSRGHQRGCGKRESPTPTTTGPRRVPSWQRVGEQAQFECLYDIRSGTSGR